MNISKAKTVPIEQVLYRMGINPQKTNGFDVWYLSPFKLEKSASFKINTKLNKWYCHSSGFGGNTVDFGIKKSGCSISEALTYLKDFDVFFSFQEQNFETPDKQIDTVDYIEKITPVNHIALIQYLNSRGITKHKKANHLKEIHYLIKDKKYFALGFRNDSGGFEVRSKYAKICLGKKDITFINNESETIRVFEGFFDYLSWKEIETESSNYLILNSISLLKKNLKFLKNHSKIESFLDNDLSGNEATNFLIESFDNLVDCRELYINYKDLNEYLVNQLENGNKNKFTDSSKNKV